MSKPQREKPLTRLIDADPMWVSNGNGDGTIVSIMFECPIHADDCRIGVSFTPTFGGPGPVENEKLWKRTGETYETVTFSPSIRVLGGADGCEWHGYIRDGKFETLSDSK